MGAVRRVVCGKLEGDPADPEPGEGSQRSGRESETGTDSSSPDTGAGTKRGWPTSRGALQWALCQPQVLVCSGATRLVVLVPMQLYRQRDQGRPEAPFSTHTRRLVVKAPSVGGAQGHPRARAEQQGRSLAAAVP